MPIEELKCEYECTIVSNNIGEIINEIICKVNEIVDEVNDLIIKIK